MPRSASVLVSLLLALFLASGAGWSATTLAKSPPASPDQPAGDRIEYFECRADNDTAATVVALDRTSKKVCDLSAKSTWIVPTDFESGKVVWNDASSTKTMSRRKKEWHYEHDVFLFVHIGRCKKIKAAPPQTCRSAQ